MTARAIAEAVLLWSGVGAEVVCCAGAVLMRHPLARLHYAMGASSVGPVLIATAVILHEAFTQAGINALVVAVTLFVLGPVLASATARAWRARELGGVRPREEEVDA